MMPEEIEVGDVIWCNTVDYAISDFQVVGKGDYHVILNYDDMYVSCWKCFKTRQEAAVFNMESIKSEIKTKQGELEAFKEIYGLK